MTKIRFVMAAALVLLLASQAFCLDDTEANRKVQVERYLKAVPPAELFQDMTEKLATLVPPENREMFKATMSKNLDLNAITKATSDAMVKHFTADELAALANFYGSPVGKSAMKKFADYMADVMPTLQEELEKAAEKTSQQYALPQ